ncbi:threonine synthase [Caminicella sporogenes]|nr:threonine synthase [Caminicella sporogenes]WIF95332.1 threonine synthase [Caminicella sporogenes]
MNLKNLFYKSTRSSDERVKSCEAIVKGLAGDGGLFVPVEIPKIEKSFDELMTMNYKDLAFYIMKKYFTDFDECELKECIEKAYDEKFETQLIAPVVEKAGVFFLELYHGPTLAFKDMALSILPYLLIKASKKLNVDKKIVILTATSGDTGKAALEGFADVEGVKIIVFYPQDGVSEVQRMQMITQRGLNTFVVGIKGNFDDAQRGVKETFADRKFNKKINDMGYMFSSANSINIGRLVPQIVYYFYAYLNLLKEKKIKDREKINIVVPTGNFGNILAAYYAKKMGLPVNKLICASNENNVLYDFINTGIYDRRREFKKTISPSMDILVSSNLERFLYDISDCDEKVTNDMMNKLNKYGIYEIPDEMKEKLDVIYSGYATEYETYNAIEEVYNESDYLIDTHTAVAYFVYKKYKEETNDNTKTIIASTASPFKFTRDVLKAVDNKYEKFSDFELIEKMAELLGTNVPKGIKDLNKREVLHKYTCKGNEIKETILKLLEGK